MKIGQEAIANFSDVFSNGIGRDGRREKISALEIAQRILTFANGLSLANINGLFEGEAELEGGGHASVLRVPGSKTTETHVVFDFQRYQPLPAEGASALANLTVLIRETGRRRTRRIKEVEVSSYLLNSKGRFHFGDVSMSF